jgi:hypothetical protein
MVLPENLCFSRHARPARVILGNRRSTQHQKDDIFIQDCDLGKLLDRIGSAAKTGFGAGTNLSGFVKCVSQT